MSRLMVGLAFVLALNCGCGGEDLQLYQVKGQVTIGGKPIEAGEVVIEPDGKKGNTGTQCRAPIKGGQYQTPKETGAVGGHVVIRVHAYDGKPHPENELGSALFYPPYEIQAELPNGDTEYDIDVPSGYGNDGN